MSRNEGPNTTFHDLGATPTNYDVVGIANLTGNGNVDIVYQNPMSGDLGWNQGPNTPFHDLGTASIAYKPIGI